MNQRAIGEAPDEAARQGASENPARYFDGENSESDCFQPHQRQTDHRKNAWLLDEIIDIWRRPGKREAQEDDAAYEQRAAHNEKGQGPTQGGGLRPGCQTR